MKAKSDLVTKQYLGVVATYPLMKGRGEIKMCVFQKGERTRVATNVYLRKMLEKQKNRSANFKNKGSGVVYARGKVLAPHMSITRDNSL